MQGTPPNIGIDLILPETIESLGYIFAGDSIGLSSFKFSWWLRQTHPLCNTVRNGRSRSSKGVDFSTNRKRICDFLLVITAIFKGRGLRVETARNVRKVFAAQKNKTRCGALHSLRAALCCHLANATDLLTPVLRTITSGWVGLNYRSPFVDQSSPDYVTRRGKT